MKAKLTGEKNTSPSLSDIHIPKSCDQPVLLIHHPKDGPPSPQGKAGKCRMQNAECGMRNEGNGWRGASFACPRNQPLFGQKAKRPPPRGRRSDGHAGIRQTATFRAIRHFADAKCRADEVEGFLREAPWGTPLSGALLVLFCRQGQKST